MTRFRERSKCPRIWFWDLGTRFRGLAKHMKAHNFVWQGCFFFHSYLATSTTNWAQISQVCYFMHVEIHQERRIGLWQLPIVSSVFKETWPVEKSIMHWSLLFIIWTNTAKCKRRLLSCVFMGIVLHYFISQNWKGFYQDIMFFF